MVVGLWIAYLVPHKLRHRQQMLESRTDDRFSEALRVLAVTGPEGSGRRRRAELTGNPRTDCGPVDKRAGLLTPGTGARIAPTDRGGTHVDRPHGTQERVGADAARRTAQLHAAHAAATARRGAAARRRGLLAGLLVAATVVGWVVVGVTSLGVLAGLAPSVLLATVLGLGRRAVVQGQAAETEWQRRIVEASAPLRQREARPGRQAAAGRAVRPSATDTQAITRVRVDGEAPGTVRTATRLRDGGREGDTWSPVAVPRPTYAMKASAPRREPVPLGDVEASTLVAPARTSGSAGIAAPAAPAAEDAPAAAAEQATTSTATGASQESPTAPGAGTTAPATDEPTGSIDLDAVLARRRAAGE